MCRTINPSCIVKKGSDEKKTVEEAEVFIRLQLILAREKQAAAESETEAKKRELLERQSREAIARAMHTIMDATSPAHNKDGWPVGFDPKDLNDHVIQETLEALNNHPEILERTLQEMNLAYEFFLKGGDPYRFPVNREPGADK